MGIVLPPAKVLVTGASGFVGAGVVDSYIKAGFKVRGTVRSPSKGEYLKKLFGENFEYAIVGDISAPGAFEEAIKGVEAVAHTASPFHFHSTNPNDYYVPAIQGTLGILETAAKTPSVKRVVITSSNTATWQPQPKGYIWTEKDWNTHSGDLVAEKGGAAAGPVHLYFASKYFGEKAAWDYVKNNQGRIKFDIATLCPPWVFGPAIQEVKDIRDLNTSSAKFRDMILDPRTVASEQELTHSNNSFVDVRDLAQAHVLATIKPEASNERFMISQGAFSWQQFMDAANEAGIKANVGYVGAPLIDPILFDGSKATRVLGLKYTDPKVSAADTARNSVERWGYP